MDERLEAPIEPPKPVSTAVKRSDVPSTIEDTETEDLKRRIERYEERMTLNGGKLLGWDNEEHAEFLRLKMKHHAKVHSPAFLAECMSCIPIHSREEIQEHIERYAKQCDLEDAKKELIVQYKAAKE